MLRLAAAAAALLELASLPVLAQDDGGPAEQSSPTDAPDAPSPKLDVTDKEALAGAVSRAVELLTGMQESFDEGAEPSEWPYEGVYRVAGDIPIGYRVGGTAIAGMALLQAPGYDADEARQAAVARGLGFVVRSVGHPLMNPDYDGGYDTRGWGYTYAVQFILRLKAANALPEDQVEAAERALASYLGAIEQTEIPRVGGWNYARARGKDAPSPVSPFMTAPTLQSLFEARRAGYQVDEGVVERAIAALEKGRTVTGSFAYSGAAADQPRPESVPGSIGRMVASEATLYLCGRSSIDRIRAAVDSFIVHWEWLNKRRAQPGTHARPYGVAPYYFYYAHYYAAQAVEQLPEQERAEYRRRLNELLFSVRLEDGSWNDRVFKRSRNYGTAMAVMAILMPDSPRPASWSAGKTESEQPSATPAPSP
jgi:hypothetical protein